MNNGGPAFPQHPGQDDVATFGGITKLEWFAGMAMMGDWAKNGRPNEASSDFVYQEKRMVYYKMAEHMLAESEKRNSGQ